MQYISKKWAALVLTGMVSSNMVLHHPAYANPPAVPPIAFPPTPTPRPALKPLTDAELKNFVIPPSFQSATTTSLAIVYNGYRRSQIDPCGCVSNQLGGLDKEAHVIQTIEENKIPTFKLDAGGFVKDLASDTEKHRVEYVLKGLAEIGYDVINVGFTDLHLGVDVLKKYEEETGIPFVSANIQNKDGALIFKPYSIKTSQLGDGTEVNIGVIGLTRPRSTNPTDAEGIDFKITDVNTALEKYLPEVKEKSDMVVVLLYDRRERSFELLKAVKTKTDVDLIITGENAATYGNVQQIEGVKIVSGGYEGRQVGVLYTTLENKKIKSHDNRFIEIVQSITPVAEVSKFLTEAKNASAKAPAASTPAVGNKLNLD